MNYYLFTTSCPYDPQQLQKHILLLLCHLQHYQNFSKATLLQLTQTFKCQKAFTKSILIKIWNKISILIRDVGAT